MSKQWNGDLIGMAIIALLINYLILPVCFNIPSNGFTLGLAIVILLIAGFNILSNKNKGKTEMAQKFSN